MKKIIITALISAGFTSISANATPATPPPNAFGSYVYVGGEVGFGHSNWSDFTGLSADDNGVAAGGKIGYQATPRFGAEVGGFVLPKSDQTATLDPMFGNLTGTVKSWVGYGAATFRIPLFKNERFYLRGKVGPAYRSLQHSGTLYDAADVGTGHYWTAILGASLNYAFGSINYPVIAGVEYSNIFGSSESWTSNGVINANAAPSVQIVAATLSMAFRI